MERLWITEPARATCLATVTAVEGERFMLDRALFAPRSRACRHPQYADEGTVWWEGEKRRLDSVQERGSQVWYTLRGTVPDAGVELQCQLDQDVRAANDRAHTAMHLVIAALAQAGAPPMVMDPEVKGGGNFRITLAWPPGAALGQAMQQAGAWIGQEILVQRTFAPKDAVQRSVTPQDFQPPDPVPGPGVLPLVSIGDVCTYPCDGTHVDRTSRIAGLEVSHAAQGQDGFVVVVRVS